MLRKLIISLTFCSLGTSFASAQQLPSPDVARTIKQNLSAAVAPALVGTLESYWEVHKIDSFGNASIHKRLTSCEAIATKNWVFSSSNCVQPKHDYTSILLEKAVFKTNDGKMITLTKNYKQISSFYTVFARKENLPFTQIQLGHLHTHWQKNVSIRGSADTVKTFDTVLFADDMLYANTVTLKIATEQKWKLNEAFFKGYNSDVSFPVNTSFSYLSNEWSIFTPVSK